ncbi:MAG: HYR domain-containing protein, partial [Sediminibacterium sp.]|nr:HYR domain-containing protein [Sediminibacterium sp.]
MKTVLRKYFFLLVMMLPASFGLVKAQPTFSSSPVTTATVGSPYTYAISATDPSNNPLTFTAITQPAWLTINSTGQSTASQFGSTVTSPGGIAGDDAGNIYVTNLSGTGVYKITPDGTTTLWFTRQAGYVYGMYVYNNDLFISYYTNNVSLKSKITKVNLSNPGAGETTVLTGANNNIYLSMTYYNGFMYIAAYGLNKVIKLDLNSGITTDVVNLAPYSGRPFGLGFNSAGLLYIASYTNASLYTYNLSASVLTQVLTGLANPSDVKIDVNDNIYISGYKYVRKYTPNLISYVTAYTATSYVWGMSVTPTGALVFGDNAGNKVAKLQTGASLTGTPALSYIGNNSVTVRVSNGITSTDQSYNIVVTGPPTIASLADITKTISDAPFAITDPASNSAGTFSYSSSNTAVATISGNTVTITGAGSTTITAVQAADANYSSGSTTALLTVTNNTPATGPAGINSGITMWLDASDIDADANAANDPATNSSLAIWKDKSGLAHNATTIPGQNPITFVTNQINGNPVAHFTRSTDFVGSALLANNVDIRSGINPEVTMFTVYKSAPLAGYQSIWGNDDGNWDRFFYNSWNGTNDGLVSLGGGNTVGITGAGTPGYLRLLTAVYKKSTLNGSAIYFNGAVVNRFTDNTDPLAALPNMGIGWDGDNGAFNGDIAEMIVYNRKLTDCEILQINQYLGAKYGVTFSSATITPSAATTICQGATVTLTANTGDSFQWYKDGVSIPSATESAYGATLSGTYTVAITTAGCTATSLGTVVTVNPLPTAIILKTDVACIGGNDGSITITAGNGTAPYQYSKDGGATYLSSNVFSGLTAGTYNIVVKPATGCISSAQPVTVSTVPDVTAPVMSGIINSVPSSILANVPEASQYQLVYKLPIPNSANWDAGSVIPYSVNNAAALAGINFGRVAYYMELDNKWVWVSMDKFTNNVALTGIPTGATLFQQNVNNMNVLASSNAGIVTGNNIATGNIELWSHCYGTQNTASVPGASGSLYDFGDYVTTQDCYGSFQVHNYGAHQTLFAYNRWSNSGNSDLGIGNNIVVNQHPDWTYMTNAGNYANKNMYVFISGGIQDITANTDLGGCTATVAISTPQATDNCGVVTVTGVRSDNLAITAPYPTGNTTITWTAKDASNNASSTTQVVTVKDITPPTFTAPAHIINPVNGSGEVVATGPSGAIVNYSIPSASDNCGPVTVVATPASGSMFAIGATTVTVTATDAYNNSVQTSFVVTVSGLAPQIVCPANIEVNNTPGVCGANVPFAATETYGIPASTITYSHAPGSFFPVGTTTVTATATNAVGSDVCTFTIIVKDNENPTFTPPVVTGTRTITIPYGQTCCWNSFVYNFTDPLPAGAVVTGIDLSYSGKDQGWGGTGDYNQLFVSGTYIGGNQYLHYTQAYTVNFAGAIPGYVYGGNNTFQMNFTGYPGWQGFFYGGPMTIHYTINTNKSVNNDAGQCGAIVPLSIPVTADNCGVASVVNDAPSVFPVGTTTVTWTVTDIHGNKNTTTQSVTVTDNEKPTISIAPVSANNDLGACSATVNIGTPVTGDNCGVASVVNDHASNVYPVGTTTVTWTVTDIHGNTNTTTQLVTVTDNEQPT